MLHISTNIYSGVVKFLAIPWRMGAAEGWGKGSGESFNWCRVWVLQEMKQQFSTFGNQPTLSQGSNQDHQKTQMFILWFVAKLLLWNINKIILLTVLMGHSIRKVENCREPLHQIEKSRAVWVSFRCVWFQRTSFLTIQLFLLSKLNLMRGWWDEVWRDDSVVKRSYWSCGGPTVYPQTSWGSSRLL